MKKVVKKNNTVNGNYVHEFNIVVNFEIINEFIKSSVKSGERKPFEDLNHFNRGEYEAFLTNVESKFLMRGFLITNEHFSKNDDLSFYFDAYKKSDVSEMNVRCVIFVRLSDHEYSINNESIVRRAKYYNKLADGYKQPKSKLNQDYELVDVVVDGHSNDSYLRAELDIKNKIEELLELYWEK